METKLDSYAPVLLSTQELILNNWPQIEPMLEKAMMLNEYKPSDILDAAMNGRMYIIAFKSEEVSEWPNIRMVLVMAPVLFPQLPTMSFVCVAGSDLRYFIKRFWKHIASWCYVNGVRAIDSFVPERLEPLMSEMGFTRESIHVRTYLSGD